MPKVSFQEEKSIFVQKNPEEQGAFLLFFLFLQQFCNKDVIVL